MEDALELLTCFRHVHRSRMKTACMFAETRLNLSALRLEIAAFELRRPLLLMIEKKAPLRTDVSLCELVVMFS